MNTSLSVILGPSGETGELDYVVIGLTPAIPAGVNPGPIQLAEACRGHPPPHCQMDHRGRAGETT